MVWSLQDPRTSERDGSSMVMAKLDIDNYTDLAIEYEVSAVLTVLAIINRDWANMFLGIKEKVQLKAFLRKLIG